MPRVCDTSTDQEDDQENGREEERPEGPLVEFEEAGEEADEDQDDDQDDRERHATRVDQVDDQARSFPRSRRVVESIEDVTECRLSCYFQHMTCNQDDDNKSPEIGDQVELDLAHVLTAGHSAETCIACRDGLDVHVLSCLDRVSVVEESVDATARLLADAMTQWLIYQDLDAGGQVLQLTRNHHAATLQLRYAEAALDDATRQAAEKAATDLDEEVGA